MSDQMSLWDTPSATSLPVLEAGVSDFENPDGLMSGQCSPSCEHKHGGQNEALLGALEGNNEVEK